jgi:hypothetical protein
MISARPDRALIVTGFGCFVVLNFVAGTGEVWPPVELAILLTILAMGVWSLYRPQPMAAFSTLASEEESQKSRAFAAHAGSSD